jgi:hypothetical protein
VYVALDAGLARGAQRAHPNVPIVDANVVRLARFKRGKRFSSLRQQRGRLRQLLWTRNVRYERGALHAASDIRGRRPENAAPSQIQSHFETLPFELPDGLAFLNVFRTELLNAVIRKDTIHPEDSDIQKALLDGVSQLAPSVRFGMGSRRKLRAGERSNQEKGER